MAPNDPPIENLSLVHLTRGPQVGRSADISRQQPTMPEWPDT